MSNRHPGPASLIGSYVTSAVCLRLASVWMITVLILDMALILSLSAKFYAFANGIALGLGFTAFLLIVAHGKQKYEKEICRQWKLRQ